MAVFPASEAPTNSTVFPVAFDFLRTSTVITLVKPGLVPLVGDDHDETDQNPQKSSKTASADDA